MQQARSLLFVAAATLLLGASPSLPTSWVGSWAASQQIPGDKDLLPDPDLQDATLRQVVRMSTGGKRVRVQLSNAFGTEPLAVDAAHIALAPAANRAGIDAATDRALSFDGAAGVLIPAGANYWSDPVALDVPALATIAVTLHLPFAPKGQTSHPGSRSTSYLVHGNHVGDADLPGAKTVEHWYQLAGIAVATLKSGAAVVTFGDSITDGHGATTNGNDRWPDRLAERLQKAGGSRPISVLNHGIGGNRLLRDGTGPNALARFDRDVLAQPGVRYVIVLEGINDLGTLTRDASVTPQEHTMLVARMTGAYRQMIDRAHGAGIKVYGATILPDGGSGYYHPDAQNEADRLAVNTWIRKPGNFDAVIDFDAVTRDPADPRRIRAAYDSGDGLHPSPAGYRAMADAIPLRLFR
ncbi:SGNH/GDSL hydrolase family protein [Sphingosinicellaceae bacterium]|nr:SGNH/GDSL hydrolase family protein [Sphingosinicellaceae bacterium]